MSSSDLSPHDSNLGASDLLGGSVHESNPLTQVELGLLGGGDTLNLDQGAVGVVGSLGSLVRNVLSLHVH